MASPATSLLTMVKILSRDSKNKLTLYGDDSCKSPCTITPDFDEALIAAHRSIEPVFVRVSCSAGESVMAIRPLANDKNKALLVENDAVEKLLANVIENLVNQVAHDVRNHAFTIGLQAELGLRRAGGVPEARGHFETVLRQLDNLKIYLEKLLLYGRPVLLTKTNGDLASFIREQVQRYLFTWDPSQPPLAISIKSPEHSVRLDFDARYLSAAFLAILDNAARSASPAPAIEVALHFTESTAIIEVRDEGGGIPPDVLAKLTTPMAVRRAHGAGLGIAIARKMAFAHRGALEIESTDKGTTVRIVLPREAPPG